MKIRASKSCDRNLYGWGLVSQQKIINLELVFLVIDKSIMMLYTSYLLMAFNIS